MNVVDHSVTDQRSGAVLLRLEWLYRSLTARRLQLAGTWEWVITALMSLLKRFTNGSPT